MDKETTTQSTEIRISAWNPDIEILPEIVRQHLDQPMSWVEFCRRQHAVKVAIDQLARWGGAKCVTVEMEVQGDAQSKWVKKLHQFYKLECKNPRQRSIDGKVFRSKGWVYPKGTQRK